ncbi:hypothetical protein ACOMHN_017154 [Nucella lapillus]
MLGSKRFWSVCGTRDRDIACLGPDSRAWLRLLRDISRSGGGTSAVRGWSWSLSMAPSSAWVRRGVERTV